MNHLARGLLQVQPLEIMVFIDRDRECLVPLELILEGVGSCLTLKDSVLL